MKRGALIALAAVVVAAIAGFFFRAELRGLRARVRAPRIVVVTLDTLHVDYTGPYNAEVDYTPVLDRMASEGVVFQNAYATVPITLPSHTSLFSGRLPPDLGVMVNGDVVDESVTTMAEILLAHGYRTAAFPSLGVLQKPHQLAQGFEHYDDAIVGASERWYRTADEVVALAAEWLADHADEPFLLWLHLSDPHEPYLPKNSPPDVRLELDGGALGAWTLATKERYAVELELSPGAHRLLWSSLRTPRADDSRNTSLVLESVAVEAAEPVAVTVPEGEIWLREPFALELVNPGTEPVAAVLSFRGRINAPPPTEVLTNYPLEVAYTDRYLGEFERLLAERGLAEDTLWVVVSDHGEGLFRYGSIGHATYTQEDQLRIVWLMKGPGVAVGSRIEDRPVLIEDVLPTVLDLLGLPLPEAATGRSQRGCWAGGTCFEREEWWAYAASVGNERITALAGYRWPHKLLWQNKRRTGYFDVVADPWEAEELSRRYRDDPGSEPEKLARLQAQIERHRRVLQNRLEARSAAELTDELERMMKALGYLNE